MRHMKINIVFMVLVFFTSSIKSQNLLDILEKEEVNTPKYAEATFSFSRISFGHSVQTRKKGVLDIFISNRFWNKPQPRSQSFVADLYSGRFGFDYGVSDKLLIGFGATTFDDRFDGFLKYNLAKQRVDDKKFPVSISLFQNISYFNDDNDDEVNIYSPKTTEANKFAFSTQLLIATKISNKFSLQLSPTFVHRGFVYNENDPRNQFALGFGARYKVGGHVSIVSEYYYVANTLNSFDTYGPFSLGVNWELSRVMLQFMLTNAVSMVEDAFIVETRNNFNFKPPNLNFGFNFTYTFHLKNELKNN